MFVTKLTEEGNCSTDAKDCVRTKEIACGKPEYIIYRFRSLEDILSLCAVLKKRGYTDESRFFVVEEKNRRYYLCLSAEEPAAGEFGGVLMSCNELCYLAEHGRIVYSDAVNVLGNLR